MPISPHQPSFHLYAGGARNLVNESSLSRRIQKPTQVTNKQTINQSFLSENSTTYLTLQTACLKLKAGPNLAHFSSSTKFSPLRRGRAEFGQREFAWQTHTKTNTTLEKGLCLSANIYATNSTYLYKTATQYSYFFSTTFFLMQNFLFSF